MQLSASLAVVGALLEVAGFLLVAVELARAQRRELGTAGPFQFLVTFTHWVRRTYRKLTGKTITREGSAHLTGTVKLSGRVSARLETQSKDSTERLRVLEENFKQLDTEVARHREELDTKIDNASNEQRSALVALEARLQAEAKAAREVFETSTLLQWWGIGLFVLGAMVSATSNIVSYS